MGKCRVRWPSFALLRLASSFRRSPLSRKGLIVAAACVVYLGFVVSQVGRSQQHRGPSPVVGGDRQTRGLHHLENLPETGANSGVPTRSNVVYITLKSKRHKPANIRGTVRPKLRRKAKRNQSSAWTFTQREPGASHRLERNFAPKGSWTGTKNVDYGSLGAIQKGEVDSIRIYSQRAPPWLSAQDVRAMRFLAGAKVLRVREASRGELPTLLMFEGETGTSVSSQRHTRAHTHARRDGACGGECGVISSPVDTTEVFAFHLDRVLGLNRTLPAVSRKFSFLYDGQPCPVVSWDASLYPQGLAAGPAAVKLTWEKYQSSLKQRCWYKNIAPKSDSDCSTIHHYEWSKVALFDFLLQIHSRLDQSCCGFRPRPADACRQAECGDPALTRLANIIHRSRDPRRLVFTDNKGFFDRNEDNLDFRLLEGIKELPEQAVSVLRSRRLREKLLQSLFLDQTYWESQGGRQGIDKLIDVIERRANVLLTYINAHGIDAVTMSA